MILRRASTGTGTSRRTYELDLSLVNECALAWRTMYAGGWSLDSTFGIRLNGSAVNGTNDWEEDCQNYPINAPFVKSPIEVL